MNHTPTPQMPALHVGSGYRYGALTWFPVWTDQQVTPRRYRTNPEGLVVSELDDADVPHLVVQNESADPIVVFEGSVFEGGWQNRSLVRTTMIPARAEQHVPVVCVEAHRWGGETLRHRVGGRIAPSRVRAASRGVSRDGATIRRSSSDQQRVWSEVRSYQDRHQMISATQSMAELDDQIAQGEGNLPDVTALPGQRGVIVAALGQPIALELFDHPDTLAEKLTEILRGFRLDVYGAEYVETPSRRARRFVARISQAGLHLHERDQFTELFRAPDNPYVATDAVALDQGLLHLSALNAQHELVLAA